MSEVIKPTNLNKKRFPATTRVEIDDQVVCMNHRNQNRLTGQIRDRLEPGTPVYIETIHSSHGLLGRPYSNAVVFLSDGNFEDNRFGIQQGKQNRAYVGLFNNGESRTYAYTSNAPYHNGLSVPSSGYSTTWNEGTFSPAGGHPSSYYHASGTAKLIIGDKVSQLADVVNKIRFAQDAFLVDAPRFYSTARESIITHNNLRKPAAEREAEMWAGRDLELIAFAVKMLKQAMRKKDDDFYSRQHTVGQRIKHADFQGGLEASESTYTNGDQPFKARRLYSIEPSDFSIHETQHPRRRIGYLRLGVGAVRGALFLPTDRNMDRVAKLAFSDDFVKKHYPNA